jgi:hypothetical protein
MGMTKMNRTSHRGKTVAKRIAFSKIVEVSFWGTVIWGLIRMVAHFLNFTPYGIDSYARPLMGLYGENSPAGMILGTLVLFVATIAAALIYSVLFSRARIWWGGILYGLAFLLVAGFFFRIGHWNQTTLSTEVTWFLSFGLFIGMTLMLERNDQV